MKVSLVLFLFLFSINLFPQNWPEAVEKWSFPQKVVNDGLYPHITPDGNRLYFLSYGGYNYIDRTDTGWSERHLLGPQINGFVSKRKIVLSPDEKTLFFTATYDIRIYRSFWDDSLSDWGPASLILDNGFNSGYFSWEVGNFLNDSTMIVLFGDDIYISYFDYSTSLWSKPARYPDENIYLTAEWGCWMSPDRKKFYFSRETYSPDRGIDLFVGYKNDSTIFYNSPKTLNISIVMDSLYKIGEINGNHEVWPTLTADGKTMFFQTNYDSGKFCVYESRMLIDENGDTVVTGIDISQEPDQPDEFYLYPSYPNPFNSSTIIKYSLKSTADVDIKLYDILGRFIKNIYSGEKKGGLHTHQIETSGLSSGSYIVSVQTIHGRKQQKILLIK
jgi:hypothetical protein